MQGEEFKVWREAHGVTQSQVAEKFGVSRATIINWEAGVTPVTRMAAAMCEMWGKRLRQLMPHVGPVTLVYSDGPLALDPYGRRIPMLKFENFDTNQQALARVRELWKSPAFFNFFIQEGEPPVVLWNSVELMRVASGEDIEAP